MGLNVWVPLSASLAAHTEQAGRQPGPSQLLLGHLQPVLWGSDDKARRHLRVLLATPSDLCTRMPHTTFCSRPVSRLSP